MMIQMMRGWTTLFAVSTAPSRLLLSFGSIGCAERRQYLYGGLLLRLFCSTRRGQVHFYDHQDHLSIDQGNIVATASAIRDIIGYESYDVTLVLVDDAEMTEVNFDSRGLKAPTDILSFPLYNSTSVGVLEKPRFNLPVFLNLGDILIDVPYVVRQCREDESLFKSDKEYLDDGRDKGVSRAMAEVFNPETRINMLLVHGMLHLVGYDHETEADYNVMTYEEEKIIESLGLKA